MTPHVAYIGVQNVSYSLQCCACKRRDLPQFVLGEVGFEMVEGRGVCKYTQERYSFRYYVVDAGQETYASGEVVVV